MAGGPASIGQSTDVHGHAQAVAGVKGHAAHMHHIPARPQVARAHLGVGFKSATGQHDGFAVKFGVAAGCQGAHPGDTAGLVFDQLRCRCFIVKVRTGALQYVEIAFLQPHAAAVHREHVVVGGGRWHPVMPLAGEPMHGLQRFGDMHVQQLFIALVVGDAHEFVPDVGLAAAGQSAIQQFA